MMMRYEKMMAKYIKGYVCERVFFSKFSGWQLATSLRINIFTDNFQKFWLNEHLPMVTSRFYTKCL